MSDPTPRPRLRTPTGVGAALGVLAVAAALRLAFAATLPPATPELALWQQAPELGPAPHWAARLGELALGRTPLALRALGVLAAAGAPALLVPHAGNAVRLALAAVALPGLVWGGVLVGGAPWVYAGACAALAGVLGRRPGLGLVGAALVLAGAAVQPSSPVWALAAGGVLLLPGAAWALAALRAGDRVDHVCLGAAALGVAGGLGVPGLAAAGWTALALGLSRAGGRYARGSWVAAGLGLGASVLLVAHSFRPVVVVREDPTARVGIGADLARSVEAWGAPRVYAEDAELAAMLRWHGGVDAHALPAARPAAPGGAATALYVRPWTDGPSAAVDAFCAERGGANVVSEYNPDGTPLERWQVYEVRGCSFPEPR